MIILACIDDRGGMMFNSRRQSLDRRLREYILKLAAPGKIWMNRYSSGQFEEGSPIRVDEDFLSKASPGEFCFVEDRELYPYTHHIEKLILFCWNRSYPADFYLDRRLLENRRQVFTEEFRGFSHEKITREDYA